ncbi:MAG: HDIG domain-containing protein [Clostridium sp.]
MYKDKIAGILKHDKVVKGSIFSVTFLIVFFILVGAVTPEKYFFNVGDIATSDIKSPTNIENTVVTEQKRKEAASKVGEQITIDTEVTKEVYKNIQHLFSKTLEIKSSNVDDIQTSDLSISDSEKELMEESKEHKEKLVKLKRLRKDVDIRLSDENFMILLSLNANDFESLKIYLESIMDNLYEGYQINTDHKQAQDFINSKFNISDFGITTRELGKSIGYKLVKPNVKYDEVKTKQLKDEAMKAVQVEMIKENQIIVKEGEPVTDNQIDTLRILGLYGDEDNFTGLAYIALMLLIGLTLSVEGYYIHKYHRKSFNNKTLILISLLQCFSILLARILSYISPLLIPLACAPMLMALLIEGNLSIIVNIINCIFIAIATGGDVSITLIALMNAIVGTSLLRDMDTRNDILFSSLYIAGINVVLTVALGLLQMDHSIKILLMKCGYVLIASLLSGVLTIGVLSSLESLFDIVTTVKLLELSNPNQPLLKRLLMEAPGTYHHSVLVANLSELAAESIGANAVLARVGAYYHDVGKLKRAYFFKENQVGMSNPHDKLTPNLSTLIIIGHVKDGIELAKEYKLPEVIEDIIRQHHGTSLVKYFYITMKNTSDKPEEIREEDFRYPGPNPLSREAGIIMLADGVEAAVRSISEPTTGKIQEMVNNIIKGRLNEGHLDNCDLTLKDIDKIREAFLKGLSGIYHERIEYPKLINKDDDSKIENINTLEDLDNIKEKKGKENKK